MASHEGSHEASNPTYSFYDGFFKSAVSGEMASYEGNPEASNSNYSFYDGFFKSADPRVFHLFLMDTPIPVAIICMAYVYFVKVSGPKFMENRQPYDLRSVLIIYNAAQTIFSTWLFYKTSKHWITFYGLLGCVPNLPDDENFMLGIRYAHLYFLSKISELADTVFFVLKKKNNHISVLHVFHHTVMVLAVWCFIKFNPGGNLAFSGIPNLFVHIWMYLYYMVAAMGPQYQKYIWWKRHMTQMQLGQFFLIFLYLIYTAYKCNYSTKFLVFCFAVDTVFVYLFLDFYRKSYQKKKNNKKAEKVDAKIQEATAERKAKEN